jgi:hypothetical protein
MRLCGAKQSRNHVNAVASAVNASRNSHPRDKDWERRSSFQTTNTSPSLSCSKALWRNGLCSSFARSSRETALFSGTGASFLFGVIGRGRHLFIFPLKGCAFLYLLIHNFRLYLRDDLLLVRLAHHRKIVCELCFGPPAVTLCLCPGSRVRDAFFADADLSGIFRLPNEESLNGQITEKYIRSRQISFIGEQSNQKLNPT